MCKNKIFELIETISRNDADILISEYTIKNYNSENLLNKIVYFKEQDKYFKIIPYLYKKDEPRWISLCSKCSLKNNHSMCNCLDYNTIKIGKLFSKTYTFYLQEISYYEALFGGDEDEE